LQAELKLERFLRMQAAIAEIFGISPAQRRNASGVQAARCSEVKPSALPALVEPSREAATATVKPATRKIPRKSLAVLLVDRQPFRAAGIRGAEDAFDQSQAL
jgi:hypothetical protein